MLSSPTLNTVHTDTQTRASPSVVLPSLLPLNTNASADRRFSPTTTKEEDLLQSVDNSSAEAALALLALSPAISGGSGRMPSLPPVSVSTPVLSAQVSSPTFVNHPVPQILYGQDTPGHVETSKEGRYTSPSYSFPTSGPSIGTFYPSASPYAASAPIRLPALPSISGSFPDETRSKVTIVSESILPSKPSPDDSVTDSKPALSTTTTTQSPADIPPLSVPHARRPAVTIVGEGDERFQFRCVCDLGYVEGDATIACDKCDVWQHMLCMGVDRDNVPDIYECEECRPRNIEAEGVGMRARQTRVSLEREARRAAALVAANAVAGPVAVRARRLSVSDVRAPRDENGIPQDAAPSSGTPIVAVSAAAPSENTPSLPRGRGRKGANPIGSRGTRRPLLHLGQLNAYASPALAGQGQTFALEEEEVPRMEAWAAEYLSLSKDHYSDRELRESVQAIARSWPAPAAGSIEAVEDVVMDGEAKEPSTASTSASPFPFPSPANDFPPELSPYPPLVYTALPPLPNILIKPILSSQPASERADSTSYSRPPTYALFAGDSPIPPETLILEHRSTVRRRKEYVQDPTSQWARMGVPKAHVRMLPPPMSLVLDAREWGNEARFARASCHPNALVRPIIVGDEVRFGLVSAREIGKREEICVGWEWEDGSLVHWLLEAPRGNAVEDEDELYEARQRASELVERLEAGFVGCGCPKGRERDCAVAWLVKMAKGERGPMREATGRRGHGKGGARKKKPDLGPLVGIERGWDPNDGGQVAKWETARRATEEAEGTAEGEGATEEEGEEDVSRSGTPLLPSHLNAPSVPSPLGSAPSIISELSPGTSGPRGKKRRFEQMSASPAPASPAVSVPPIKDAEELSEDTPRARKRRMRDLQEKYLAEKARDSTDSGERTSADGMEVDVAPAPEPAPVIEPAPVSKLSPAFGEEELVVKEKDDVVMHDANEGPLADSKAFPLTPSLVIPKDGSPFPAPVSAISTTAAVSPSPDQQPAQLQHAPAATETPVTPAPPPESTPIEPPAPVAPAIRKWSLKEWAAARKRGEVGLPTAKTGASPVASMAKPLEPVKEEETANTGTEVDSPAVEVPLTSVALLSAIVQALATETSGPDTPTLPAGPEESAPELKLSGAASDTDVVPLESPLVDRIMVVEIKTADLPTETTEETEKPTISSSDFPSPVRNPYRPVSALQPKDLTPVPSQSLKAEQVPAEPSPSLSPPAPVNPSIYPPLSPSPPFRQPSPPYREVKVRSATVSPKSADADQSRQASTSMEPILKEEDVRTPAREEEDEPGAIEEGQLSPEQSAARELSHHSDRDSYYDRRRELSEQRHLESPYREHPPPGYDPSRRFSPSPPHRSFPEDRRPSPEPYRERPRSPRSWAPRQQSPPRGPRAYPPPLSPVFHPHPSPSPYARPPPPGPRQYPPSAPRAIADQTRYRPEYEQGRGPPIGPRALYGPPQYQARGAYPQYGRGGPGPPVPQPRGYPPRGAWRGRGNWR